MNLISYGTEWVEVSRVYEKYDVIIAIHVISIPYVHQFYNTLRLIAFRTHPIQTLYSQPTTHNSHRHHHHCAWCNHHRQAPDISLFMMNIYSLHCIVSWPKLAAPNLKWTYSKPKWKDQLYIWGLLLIVGLTYVPAEYTQWLIALVLELPSLRQIQMCKDLTSIHSGQNKYVIIGT